MKGQIGSKIRFRQTLRWSDIFLTLIPLLLWAGGLQLRAHVIRPHCAENPSVCTRENVFKIDRLAVGLASGKADEYSFLTQYTAGALLFAVPVLWVFFLLLRKRLSPGAALAAIGTDLVIIGQTMSWNGAVIEASRLLAQRPRPFVYGDPAHLGANPAHYTSFYSGHTSFAALAAVCVVLLLAGRQAPRWLLVVCGTVMMGLALSTGVFRVLCGRHFPTDVAAALIIGAAIAWIIGLRHKRQAAGSTMTL